MRLATIQMAPKWKDYRSNLETILKMAVEAATQGAKIIVFPELATSGYSFMSYQEALPFAETLQEPGKGVSSPTLVMLRQVARRYQVHIACGLVEKGETDQIYNSQVLVCPDGSWESYRKISRWGSDWLWCSAGESNPPVRKITIDDQSLRVGLLVCRDIRNRGEESDAHFYEKGDADLILLSSNWGAGGFPAVRWMEFVRDLKIPLLISNRYGKEENNDFGHGGVALIKEDLTVQCRGLEWSKDCIVYVDL